MTPTPLTPLSDEELDELERLEKEATPGPWHHGFGDGSGKSTDYKHGGYIVAAEPEHENYPMRTVVGVGYCCGGGVELPEDADLIAALRSAAARLLSEVRARRAERTLEDRLAYGLDDAVANRRREHDRTLAREAASEYARTALAERDEKGAKT